MCISVLRAWQLTKPFIAYKHVDLNFKSPHVVTGEPPYQNTLKATFRRCKKLTYRVGDIVESPIPETPGIYLFRHLSTALYMKWSWDKVIEVEVPIGSILVYGTFCNYSAYTTNKVKVLREIK